MTNGLPRLGIPILLTSNGRTWRMELLEEDADRVVLALGDVPPFELTGLEPGHQVSCRFHDGRTLGVFEAGVLGPVMVGLRHGLALERPAQIVRNQRRMHIRVSRTLAMQIQLPLRNEALSRSRRRDFIQSCWVQATAVNFSAGGFRAQIMLPRQHAVVAHTEALVRFDLEEEFFRDRRLSLIRRDWNSDLTFLIYAFIDLQPEEIERIEEFNLSWLHGGLPSSPKEGA